MEPPSASPKNQILFGWPLKNPPAAECLAALTRPCAEPTTDEVMRLLRETKEGQCKECDPLEAGGGVLGGGGVPLGGVVPSGGGVPSDGDLALLKGDSRSGDPNEIAALAASEWLPVELSRIVGLLEELSGKGGQNAKGGQTAKGGETAKGVETAKGGQTAIERDAQSVPGRQDVPRGDETLERAYDTLAVYAKSSRKRRLLHHVAEMLGLSHLSASAKGGPILITKRSSAGVHSRHMRSCHIVSTQAIKGFPDPGAFEILWDRCEMATA